MKLTIEDAKIEPTVKFFLSTISGGKIILKATAADGKTYSIMSFFVENGKIACSRFGGLSRDFFAGDSIRAIKVD